MRRIWLQAAALVGAAALALPAGAQTPDHLACYKAGDSATKARYTLTLSNAGGTRGCRVKVPAKLVCVDSTKSNVSPTPPGTGPSPAVGAGTFLCYQVKCSRPFPPSAQLEDQFGRRTVAFKAAQLLCAPASSGPAGIVGSTTTTTLPAPQACHFNNNDRRCEGTCAAGGHCSAVTSGGDCECRSTACGDASSPECNGFCQPNEACIFDVAGCTCVSIP